MLNQLTRAGAIALACLTLVSAPAAGQAVDPFREAGGTTSSPCRHWTSVTPSDTADLAIVPKSLYFGGGGDVVLIGVDAPPAATGVKWSGVPAASLLPVRPRRIMATGTTATLIVACY